ncbi:MAG: hypothetical protein FJX65_13045 [Alphaproteobacteria bacterium]|nr:hypothetical protein [Alphaproteobacteria bacterium]
MATSAMIAVTVGVSDVDSSLRLFRDTMGLSVEHDAPVGPELAAFWGLEAGNRQRLVELSYGGYRAGRLRLLSVDRASPLVRDDYGASSPDSASDIGPKAIDFYTRPPISRAIEVMKRAGCVQRSEPIRYEIGPVESEELLFSGPDDVPMLIMVGHRHPPSSLRSATLPGLFSEIPTTSVICADLTESRRFYGEGLGLATGTDAEVKEPYTDLACRLTGVPSGTRVALLAYLKPGEPSGKLLLVHFFGASRRRLSGRMRPGHRGLSLFTYRSDDLPALERRLNTIGATFVARRTLVNGRERMLVRGPNEELIEIIAS